MQENYEYQVSRSNSLWNILEQSHTYLNVQ